MNEKLSDYLTENEGPEFYTYLELKKKEVSIGVTKYRFFLYDSKIGFFSSKKLDLIGIVRERIKAKQLIILLLLSLFPLFAYYFTSNIGVILTLCVPALLYIVYLYLISRVLFLIVCLSCMKFKYKTNYSMLKKIKLCIATLHSFGKEIENTICVSENKKPSLRELIS